MIKFVKPRPATAMAPNWGEHTLSGGASVRIADGGDGDVRILIENYYFRPSALRELADNLRKLADVMEGKE